MSLSFWGSELGIGLTISSIKEALVQIKVFGEREVKCI